MLVEIVDGGSCEVAALTCLTLECVALFGVFPLPVARVPLFALFSRYPPFEGSTYRATLNGENLVQRATIIILIFVFRGSTCNTVLDVAGRLRGRRQKSTVLFCRPFRSRSK